MPNDQGRHGDGAYWPLDIDRSSLNEPPVGQRKPSAGNGAVLLVLGVAGGVAVGDGGRGRLDLRPALRGEEEERKGSQKEPRPPDLWIHHEEMELKNLEKAPESEPPRRESPAAEGQEIQGEGKTSELQAAKKNLPQAAPEPAEVGSGASTLERSGISRRAQLLIPMNSQNSNAAVVSAIPVPTLESAQYPGILPSPPALPQFPLRPLPFPSLAMDRGCAAARSALWGKSGGIRENWEFGGFFGDFLGLF
ncbi:netrin receptor DCC-like [Aphelocoma coerulescens]|uniref:netrin receptor DCC-like n=1 Tax=Aphelocoma coerulescens TaxID=39617 RepID=UPI0036044796